MVGFIVDLLVVGIVVGFIVELLVVGIVVGFIVELLVVGMVVGFIVELLVVGMVVGLVGTVAIVVVPEPPAPGSRHAHMYVVKSQYCVFTLSPQQSPPSH